MWPRETDSVRKPHEMGAEAGRGPHLPQEGFLQDQRPQPRHTPNRAARESRGDAHRPKHTTPSSGLLRRLLRLIPHFEAGVGFYFVVLQSLLTVIL